jgi:hypothetical protein
VFSGISAGGGNADQAACHCLELDRHLDSLLLRKILRTSELEELTCRDQAGFSCLMLEKTG